MKLSVIPRKELPKPKKERKGSDIRRKIEESVRTILSGEIDREQAVKIDEVESQVEANKLHGHVNSMRRKYDLGSNIYSFYNKHEKRFYIALKEGYKKDFPGG